jgi:hypothetical protein
MSNLDNAAYLDRLLKLYDEKLNRFRLSFALLLVGTLAFFFLVFFPYITLLGNQEACLASPKCTKPKESKLEDRLSEVTTSWGRIPISTAEAAALFPVGVACGSVAITAQLLGLTRLRRAIAKQVNSQRNYIDVTLIAPLLIDSEHSSVDQLAGAAILLTPFCVAIFSSAKLLARLEPLRSKLPYSQTEQFYQIIYLLSALAAGYSFARLGFNICLQNRIAKHYQHERQAAKNNERSY